MLQKLFVLCVSVLMFASAQPECVGVECHLNGLQIISKSLRYYLEFQPADIVLGDGVHLISIGNNDEVARSAGDGSLVSSLEKYLRTHEIRIRLSELIPSSDSIGRTFKEFTKDVNNNEIREYRQFGGGKKGKGGAIMLLGLMFAKTIGAIGFGTVGLLAMKALMVSALALMLSMIIGLKKLVSSGHDDGGHTVIHATAGGHEGHHQRRKREAADIAYNAWRQHLKL